MSELFDAANPVESFWRGYSDGLVTFLLFFLGVTVIQAVLFFAANCIAWNGRK